MAVQLCRTMGYARVHFEGDAKAIIDAINSSDCDLSSLGHIVADVRVGVEGLSQWQFTFVRRNGNLAAHTLSKFATLYALDRTWRDERPDCIKETIFLGQSALDA
jgi:hypothetical protein